MRVMSELKLSKKSQEFLENLRIYLFSSGKNSKEIEDIIDELESHLLEAEEDGKSIEKIIGNSPKEYMEKISSEMDIDSQVWIKYIALIIFGSFTIKVFSDLLEGNLSYSVLEISGHIIISAVFIATILLAFKYLSSVNRPLKKQILIFGGLGFLPITLFLGLIYLNKMISTPTINFGNIGSLIVGIIAMIFILGAFYWAKTWTLMIVIGLLIVPEFLLGLTSLQYETQMILSAIITFGGVAIYLLIVNKHEKLNKG